MLANFDENELKTIIEKNNCGIFTKAGDKVAFTDAILKLYNDNALGRITDEQLSLMIEKLNKESASLKERAKEIRRKSDKMPIDEAYKAFFSLIEQYNHIDELTPEIVRTFIERIEVGEKILPEGYTVASHDIPYRQNIKIYYRFIGKIGEDEKAFNQDALPSKIA